MYIVLSRPMTDGGGYKERHFSPKRSVYEISVKTDPETLGQNETDPRQSLKGMYLSIHMIGVIANKGPGSRFVILSERLNFNRFECIRHGTAGEV